MIFGHNTVQIYHISRQQCLKSPEMLILCEGGQNDLQKCPSLTKFLPNCVFWCWWKISFRNAEWKFKEMLWHLEVFIDHFLVLLRPPWGSHRNLTTSGFGSSHAHAHPSCGARSREDWSSLSRDWMPRSILPGETAKVCVCVCVCVEGVVVVAAVYC